jgi:hypothetical protein
VKSFIPFTSRNRPPGTGALGWCCVWIGCLILCGCSGSHEGYDRYIPKEKTALAALEKALQAWQDGVEGETIDALDPCIQFIDSQRKRGQHLVRYEILGEASADAPCCYAARLVFERPAQEQTVRYVMLGIDPVRVIRHEDYAMLMHWDMNMMKQDKSGAKP